MVYVISNIYGLLDVNVYEILEQGRSMKAPFGVLQPLWDAWNEASFDETMDGEYFKRVLKHQIEEIELETEQGRLWDEWIDVVCVALNYLRTTSITPENIGKAAIKRANRYNGKTKEIQRKYKEMEGKE
tara:strand:+ start:804 stop:1190 length:387 start_codon:yes stop_codon:yes gene_type:complete